MHKDLDGRQYLKEVAENFHYISSKVNCFHKIKEKMFILLKQAIFNTLVISDSLK